MDNIITLIISVPANNNDEILYSYHKQNKKSFINFPKLRFSIVNMEPILPFIWEIIFPHKRKYYQSKTNSHNIFSFIL